VSQLVEKYEVNKKVVVLHVKLYQLRRRKMQWKEEEEEEDC
jgi:hypothetical protein